MPIEIRELHIKATVAPESGQTAPSANLSDMKDKIVAECVEQVLQVLKEKKER